ASTLGRRISVTRPACPGLWWCQGLSKPLRESQPEPLRDVRTYCGTFHCTGGVYVRLELSLPVTPVFAASARVVVADCELQRREGRLPEDRVASAVTAFRRGRSHALLWRGLRRAGDLHPPRQF